MKRMVSRLSAALALALGLAAGSAQADVVYRWQELGSALPGLPQTSGQLTILESAWSLGGTLSYRASAGCGQNFNVPGCYGWEGSPVRSISFVTGERVGGPGSGIPGGVMGFGRSLTFGFEQGYSSIFNLAFLTDGGLAGNIESGSIGEQIRMSGADTWRVSFFGTDFNGSVCGTTQGCSGATGRWVLDRSSVPDGAAGQVPVPGTLPLLALAGLGMGAALRRRQPE